MDADESWTTRCATVLPDHVHLVIRLGERLTIGKCVARLKAKSSSAVAAAAPGTDWERDFFEHQLRPDDDVLAVFLYVYLNAYRAGLCELGEQWPWCNCREEDWTWFRGYLDTDRPTPEWLL